MPDAIARTPEPHPASPTPQAKLPFSKKRLVLYLIILIFSLTTSVILLYQKPATTPPLPPDSSPQLCGKPSDQFLNWKTFTNPESLLEFKYPPEFFIDQEIDYSVVASPLVTCKTGVSGSEREVSVSEIYLRTNLRKGKSFEEIWKHAFGSEFNDSNYDGQTTIGGKPAYFFYAGAESLKATQSYLVKISDQQALEIIVESPLLVNNCDKPIDVYKGVADQILSTFRFLDTTSPNNSLSDLSTWKTYQSIKMGFEIKYPESYEAGYDNPFVYIRNSDQNQTVSLHFAPDFQGSPCASAPCDQSKAIILSIGNTKVETKQIWPYINGDYTFKTVIDYPRSPTTLTIFGRYYSEESFPLIKQILETMRFIE